jgi:hypothetical protein
MRLGVRYKIVGAGSHGPDKLIINLITSIEMGIRRQDLNNIQILMVGIVRNQLEDMMQKSMSHWMEKVMIGNYNQHTGINDFLSDGIDALEGILRTLS